MTQNTQYKMESTRTSNVERRTSNVEVKKDQSVPTTSMLDVGSSTFDVRISSKPPMHIRHSARRAFSFAEVMFAVVILGIGFIMVAAVFPVAIRQTQSTGEENTAATAARTAAVAIGNMRLVANNLLYNPTATTLQLTANPAIGVQYAPVFPPTVKNYVLPNATTNPPPLIPLQVAVPPPAIVVPFNGVRWNQLQASIISSTDPRFSYVPFYKRENGSSVAELIVISVANRNKPIYDASNDATSDVTGTSSPITATTANGVLTGSAPGAYTTIVPDTITISPGITASTGNNISPEGGSVCLSNTVSLPLWVTANKPAGRYYTLGHALSTASPYVNFELNAGDALELSAGTNGLWGTSGATTDPLLAGDACTLTQASTLQPSVGYVQSLKATPANPSGRIWLSVSSIFQDPHAPAAAVQGAFVIIADDCPEEFTTAAPASPANSYQIPTNTAYYQVGKMNGRIFRLGAPVVQDENGVALAPGTFLLDPAYGMQSGGSNSPDTFPNPNTPAPKPSSGVLAPSITARCYIIGAGKDATGNPTGAAQDLGVFATYIPVQ